MPIIYALSDIHGEMEAFERALEVVDLRDGQSRLVIAGDLIDHALERFEVYARVLELMDQYPGQVIVLKGNVDEWLLERWGEVVGRNTSKSLKRIKNWIKAMPLIYETDTQIFVHAGVEEGIGDLWKVGTDDYTLMGKFPPSIGPFDKDIIAGHVGTGSEYLANDENFHEVFWDGYSHYFLDGSSEFSHYIPVLKYDTETTRYTRFTSENGGWVEEPIPAPNQSGVE